IHSTPVSLFAVVTSLLTTPSGSPRILLRATTQPMRAQVFRERLIPGLLRSSLAQHRETAPGRGTRGLSRCERASKPRDRNRHQWRSRDSVEMFPGPSTGCSYEECQATAEWLLNRAPERPLVGIVCGSGLGGLAKKLKDPLVIDYRDIPHFPVSTVQGHAGKLVFGRLQGQPCVCMQGRFHLYEGYSVHQTTMPIRVFKLLGVQTLLLTNAAGGLNPEFKVGDVMLIKDHMNFPGLAGSNPLTGPNDERFGERFPCLSDAYDRDLRQLVHQAAEELQFSSFVQDGVYSALGGPSFETIAECRMLRALGADAVGMSTVQEVIVARHCGLRVLALSLITNMSVMDYSSQKRANHQEVLETGQERERQLEELVCRVVSHLPCTQQPC
ncbi:hypothetical protein DNTS_031630, partial [Danionella cerebrum]